MHLEDFFLKIFAHVKVLYDTNNKLEKFKKKFEIATNEMNCKT